MVIQFDFTDEERLICIKIIKPRDLALSVCVRPPVHSSVYEHQTSVFLAAFFFFRQDLSLNLEAHKSARLSSQKAPGIHLLRSP